MDWISIIQNAISYIEDELFNPALSPQLVAKHVHVSESHFTRSFHTLTGYTLSEYIRNRRLSISGEQLKTTSLTVLDIANNVGYESPEAFSKAFKRFHGVNPSESRNAILKEFYPLQLKLVLTQCKPLQYALEEKEKFYLCGSTNTVSCEDSNATAYLWANCTTDGYLESLFSFKGYKTIVGVSTSAGYTIKAICSVPSKNTSIAVPKHKWMVFKCIGIGPQAILNTWDQIYTMWIPKTDYVISDLPQLEVYDITSDGYTCEIWIAVD